MARGGNKKQKQGKQQKQTALQHRPDPSVACFALHPGSKFVAIAINDVVRVIKLREPTSSHGRITQHHAAPIRAVAFDGTGELFLSAGDEKLVQVWDTASWNLVQTIQSPKKITAAVFSSDSSLVVFADKFGDVHTAQVQHDQPQQTAVPAAFLLGHLCSIVTSLAFSPGGKQLVSTDQDCKVRVSSMPTDPSKGAHSIQSICMGHEVFAKCCTFLSQKDGAHQVLLSGGGDSTIRSWSHLTGRQLDCFTCFTESAQDGSVEEAARVSPVTATSADGGVRAASATAQSDAAKHDLGDDDDDNDADMEAADPINATDKEPQNGDANEDAAAMSGDDLEPEDTEQAVDDDGTGQLAAAEGSGQPAILSIAAAPDGCTVAAAIEGRDTILVLHCDTSSGKLSQQQEVQLPGVSLPTQVHFDAEGKLWVVGGPLTGSTHAVCIGVAACTGSGSAEQWQNDDAALSDDIKAALECREADNQIQSSTAMVNQQQVNQQLRKRVYSTAEREARKKNRNDIKESA